MTGAYLAIDTSMGTSVALVRNGTERIVTRDDPRGHAEHIGALIREVLGDTPPRDVAAVVAGIGPGLFTGLRVGLAAAKTFAFGIGQRVIPVISHDAVAVEAILGGSQRVRVVQDAKRRELFVTEYDGLDEYGAPVRVRDPHIVPRADFVPTERDLWPEAIPAHLLIRVAQAHRQAGIDPGEVRALYLRAPDVKEPGKTKRVSS